MIKILLLLLLLPLFLIFATVTVLLTFRPLREALLRHLGKRIARSAQKGRWRMEVRTWKFEAPHTKSSPRSFDSLEDHAQSFGTDSFRQLKDVSPLREDDAVDKKV